jgi:hypothetical protein
LLHEIQISRLKSGRGVIVLIQVDFSQQEDVFTTDEEDAVRYVSVAALWRGRIGAGLEREYPFCCRLKD